MVQRSMSKKSQQKPKKQQRRNHSREYKAFHSAAFRDFVLAMPTG